MTHTDGGDVRSADKTCGSARMHSQLGGVFYNNQGAKLQSEPIQVPPSPVYGLQHFGPVCFFWRLGTRDWRLNPPTMTATIHRPIDCLMSQPPRTPCIGICSTGIGDDVCRGCKRFAQEVIEWNGYGRGERQAVLDRLDQLLLQIMQSKFDVIDSDLLLRQIRYQQIPCNTDRAPLCWAFDLLRHGAGQIEQLSAFGVAVKPEWLHLPLTALKTLIDKEHFELSCAYYERYILPGERAELLTGR